MFIEIFIFKCNLAEIILTFYLINRQIDKNNFFTNIMYCSFVI